MNPDSESDIESALLNAVAGNRPGEYYVLGNRSEVPAEPGEIDGCVLAVTSSGGNLEWRIVYGIDTWVTYIQRFASNLDLLGTAEGALVRVQNGVQAFLETGLLGGINWIWGPSDDDCWLAHDNGISHWNGKKLSRTLKSGMLHRIHALRSDFAVAVGADGLILRFDGSTWKEVDSSPVTTRLIGVFCASDEEIYISGWDGVLYLWDGRDQWTRLEVLDPHGSVSDSSVENIIRYGGVTYVCMGSLGLFKLVGNRARKVQDFYSSRPEIIDGNLIITGWNTFTEFDGHSWNSVNITLP